MRLHPKINDPVILRSVDGRTYRSRVEGTEPNRLTVARPVDLPAEDEFGPGSDVEVSWTEERGIAVLPTRLVRTLTERSLRLWEVAINGRGWIEQRRKYVRAQVSGSVVLRAYDGEQVTATVQGHLVDLSEAALQCSVDVMSANPLTSQDVELSVQFRLGEAELEIPGHLLACRPDPQSDKRLAMVVLFDQPVSRADTLRRLVYAQQLRNRELSADDHARRPSR